MPSALATGRVAGRRVCAVPLHVVRLGSARGVLGKGGGFCPSCSGRRIAERAAHLFDAIFPDVPVRQWVRAAYSNGAGRRRRDHAAGWDRSGRLSSFQNCT